MSAMTLEQVQDNLRKYETYGLTNEEAQQMADAIDAHLRGGVVTVTDDVLRRAEEAYDAYAEKEGLTEDGGWKRHVCDTDAMRSAIQAITAAQPARGVDRCTSCDGTGDLHRADGEYLGKCTACTPPTHLVDSVNESLISAARGACAALGVLIAKSEDADKEEIVAMTRLLDALEDYKQALASAPPAGFVVDSPRWIFHYIGDMGDGYAAICHNVEELRSEVALWMVGERDGECLADDGEDMIAGVVDTLIGEGRFTPEGDPPCYLMELFAASQAHASHGERWKDNV